MTTSAVRRRAGTMRVEEGGEDPREGARRTTTEMGGGEGTEGRGREGDPDDRRGADGGEVVEYSGGEEGGGAGHVALGGGREVAVLGREV